MRSGTKLTYKISIDVDGDTNGSLDIFQSYFHATCSIQPPPPWTNFLGTVKGEEREVDKPSNTL